MLPSLCCFCKKWETDLLQNISSTEYNYDQLVMVFNESVKLEQEIEKSSVSSKTYYGQFTTHPKAYANTTTDKLVIQDIKKLQIMLL